MAIVLVAVVDYVKSLETHRKEFKLAV